MAARLVPGLFVCAPHILLSHGADVIAGWKMNLLGDHSGSSRKQRVLFGEGAQM